MKTTIAVFCGLGLLIAPALQAQDAWVLKSPAPKPLARDVHAMAPIGVDQVLLFGGVDATINRSDETWVYDLGDNTWTLKNPATKPLARDLHAMAYIGGDRVLLFGGNKIPGIGNDETWVYDLSDNIWTLKNPATKPLARLAMAMAYIGGDQVLLFGGVDANGVDDETWIYDLSDDAWTLKNPATKPAARRFHAMAPIGGDQVLLFGGGFPPDDETWVYDVSDDNWTLKNPATKPSARRLFAMASIGGDQVVLFGGFDAGGEDGETWVYDLSDNTWTLKSLTTQPSARRSHAMASTCGNQVLLFGGVDAGGRDDETWVYTSTSTPSNLALCKTAAASSSKPAHPAEAAADGNAGTHWRSDDVGGTTKVWWRVDLGAVYNIDNVVIDWSGSFYAIQYEIQISLNAAAGTWETVYMDNAGDGGIDNITFPATDARYVRILMTQHNEQVERINEVEVYAASGTLAKKSEVARSEVAKSEVVTDYVLEQNYPNPFNPETVISFQLPVDSEARVAIYSITGQLVRELVQGEMPAGRHALSWDGRNQSGHVVAAGMYLYQLVVRGKNGAAVFMQTRRLAFVK